MGVAGARSQVVHHDLDGAALPRLADQARPGPRRNQVGEDGEDLYSHMSNRPAGASTVSFPGSDATTNVNGTRAPSVQYEQVGWPGWLRRRSRSRGSPRTGPPPQQPISSWTPQSFRPPPTVRPAAWPPPTPRPLRGCRRPRKCTSQRPPRGPALPGHGLGPHDHQLTPQAFERAARRPGGLRRYVPARPPPHPATREAEPRALSPAARLVVLVRYVDEDLFTVPRRGGAGYSAYRLRRPAPAADHPAYVAGRHLQPEPHRLARLPPTGFDADGVWFVDDLARQVLEHGTRPSRRAPGCTGRSLGLLGRLRSRTGGLRRWRRAGRLGLHEAGADQDPPDPVSRLSPFASASASPGLPSRTTLFCFLAGCVTARRSR